MTNPLAEQPHGQGASLNRLVALAVLGVICAGIGLRWRLLDVPLDRDEGEYAYIAQRMLRGVPPYESAYAMKLPGIYAVYAAVMSVAGESIRGIHLGLLATGAATTGAMFLLGRRLYDSSVGLAAAAAFALLSTLPQVHGSSAQAEAFVLLPTVLAWWLAVRVGDRLHAPAEEAATRQYGTLLVIGLLCGVAITIKQHAIFLMLGTVLYVGLARWRSAAGAKGRVKGSLLTLATVAVGGGLPSLVMVAAIVAAGVWEKFWFWTVVVAGNYAGELPWSDGWARLRSNGLFVADAAPAIFLLAGCGLAALFFDKVARQRRGFLIVTSLTALVAICPGLHFRRHYFVLLLPAVSLLFAVGGIAVARLAAKVRGTSVTGRSSSSVVSRFALLGKPAVVPKPGSEAVAPDAGSSPDVKVLLAIVAGVMLLALWSNREHYFERSPAEIARATYGGNPFPEAVAIADYIRARTTPDETVLVMGSEPEIPFYAQRRSATRHIYMYPLVERQPYARQMQEEMIAEAEAARPAYIVLAAVDTSWLAMDGADRRLLEWFGGYTSEHYDLVGCIDVDGDRTIYKWGAGARDFRPRSNAWLKVYRRRE
ncbi:MAG: glycosyltransferase family 39 protein [Pirellulales bacterium]|nr:glycosyltransferase family 39 protein [Pirellulales bacterium]